MLTMYIQGPRQIPPNNGHRHHNNDPPNPIHLLQPRHHRPEPRPPRHARLPRLAIPRHPGKRHLLRRRLHRRPHPILDLPTKRRGLRRCVSERWTRAHDHDREHGGRLCGSCHHGE